MRSKEQPKEIGGLAEDARALLDATAHLTGQNVQRARRRLALAVKHGKTTGEAVADASADIATDAIAKLCDRIADTLNHGKEFYDQVCEDVVNRTKAADQTVREKPYHVMGVALGVGAIVGCLLSSRRSRNGH